MCGALADALDDPDAAPGLLGVPDEDPLPLGAALAIVPVTCTRLFT